MNYDEKVTVTCWYCIFYRLYYISEQNFSDEGYCRLKNIPKSAFAEICEKFKINPGIHTEKYYPGKNNSKG